MADTNMLLPEELMEADYWMNARLDENFRVLVWGPGTSHADYSLRTGIREELRKHFSQVHFSEELEVLPPGGSDPSFVYRIAMQERLHAKLAALVYLVASSPGPRLEYLLYGTDKDLYGKMHVLLPPTTSAPNKSFLDRVFEEAIADEEPTRVKRFFLGEWASPTVIEYCVKHARKKYLAMHPLGG